jgi:hypothetical protein
MALALVLDERNRRGMRRERVFRDRNMSIDNLNDTQLADPNAILIIRTVN